MINKNQQKENRTISRVIIVSSIIIAILSIWVLLTNDLAPKPLAGSGAVSGVADIGGDFSLLDHNGNEFTQENLKGQFSLIYFGFTFCPDVCPTSLQKITHLLEDLRRYNIKVLPVFITLDPKRDTISALKSYLSNFHPEIIGLTGSDEQIRHVAEKYKVYYAISEDSKAQTNDADKGKYYMLDHSSFIYLMSPDGKYVAHFALHDQEQDMLRRIVNAIKSN